MKQKQQKTGKILFIVMLAAELFLLVMLVHSRYQTREEYHYTRDQLTADESGRTVTSPAIQMDAGIYAVHLYYATDDSSEHSWSQAVASNETNLYEPIECDKINLYGFARDITYRVYVNKNSTSVTIQNGYASGDSDYLIIDNMDIVYLKGRSTAFAVLLWMFLFALLDAVVLLLAKRPIHQLDQEKRRIIIGLTAVILLINFPLFIKYIPNGHDLQFHLMRIYGIATGLSNGIFPVRIMAPWANGYGYATGVCYGDILLYFPAILYDLGFPLMWAYKSMVFLTNAAVALVSYYCFSRMGDNRNIGLTGSAVYTLGLWHVIDTYTRAAVGEADAFIFVPLVFLGLWNLAGYEKKQSKKQVETILCLTLGFSGLLQVHLLSLIMTAVFALILILTAWRKTLHRESLLVLIKSAAFTILLNLGFLIPFLDYYLTYPMQINTDPMKNIQYQGGTFAELFLTAYQTTGQAKDGLSIIGSLPFTPGLTVLAILGIAVTGCILDWWGKYGRMIRAGIAVMLFALLLSTVYMPYDWLLQHMPVLYKFLGSVQVPWRYFTIVTILGSCLLVVILRDLREQGMRRKLVVLAAAAVLCSSIQCIDYQSDFLTHESDIMTAYDGASLYSFSNLGEYLPAGAGTHAYEKTDIYTSDAGMKAGDPGRFGKNYVIPVSNATGSDQTVTVTLMMYKGYHAFDDAGNELSVTSDTANNYRVMVTVPAGYSGNVTVRFVEPWYWRMGEVISGIMVILLTGGLIERHLMDRRTDR
jgi:hypothetical protein